MHARRSHSGLCSLLFAAAVSCTADPATPGFGATPAQDGDWFSLRTEEISVPAGQERYLCYATTLSEDEVVDAYRSDAKSFVHHMVFARALAPEPEGVSECDTLFRATWDPLYIAGAGDSELAFPTGAGHSLARGTQLVLQMHLLNPSNTDVHAAVAIEMHRSASKQPRPVNTYIFGTTDLHLPPNQPSEAQSACEMTEPVQLIAGFPHMHQLGRGLRFEVGARSDAMRTVFRREPYDFDNQYIEPLALDLAAGDLTRVTCAYENTLPTTIGFGESTHDEMCFFIGFALDQREIKSCATRPVP